MIKNDRAMLKICMITPFPPKEDGVAEYSKYLVESLSMENVFLHIICEATYNQKSNDQFSNRENVRALRIWNPKSILNQFHIFKEVVRIHPDIIHAQYGPYAAYGGILGEPLLLLFTLFKLLHFRCIVTLHSVWLPSEAEARAYERIKSRLFSKLASIYYYIFMKTFLKLFDRILVCVNFGDSYVIRQIVKTFLISSLKVACMHHGSIETFSVHQKEEAKRRMGLKGKILLCIGFIRKDKGYEYAIRALTHLRKNRRRITIVIAGTPLTSEGWHYLTTLKALVNELHFNKQVIFDTRYIPEEDVFNYFLSSDILLLPYSRRVGPSGPVAMGASFGLPIIMASDQKFALHNVCAFVKLVPPRNSTVLAHAIQKLLESEEIRNKMADNALAYASKYSYREIAKRHYSIYLSTRQ